MYRISCKYVLAAALVKLLVPLLTLLCLLFNYIDDPCLVIRIPMYRKPGYTAHLTIILDCHLCGKEYGWMRERGGGMDRTMGRGNGNEVR